MDPDVLLPLARVARSSRRPLILLLAASLAVLGAALGWLVWAPAGEQNYSTPVGGYERLALEDGSLLQLNTDTELKTLFDEHRRWDRAHGEVPDTGSGPAPIWDSHRRLRVGYVSPDFYYHAAARFIEPILAHHDPEQVETFCYAEVGAPDNVTAKLRSLAHGHRTELFRNQVDDWIGYRQQLRCP